ncbi:Acg family FMN-binding oxidoreductase [Tropicimonas sp. S265A]|uniref:Acg family FMN-binding oxidoreductase n=1 Tax=Tropicimonas sp. S265A TaxID=3415134 RepID=UPI003C7E5757
MTMSRRKMIGLVGGGVVLAALPTTAFLATRTPTRALAPWDAAGQYADPRLRALSFAVLAPNAHNRQPWLAELSGADRVTIWRDPTRDLPVTDPYARQLTISMGCFLGLMQIAAAEEGFAVDTHLFPAGEEGPVAACTFRAGRARPDPLFAHVMNRRSHKDGFEARAVPPELLPSLSRLANIHDSGPRRDRLRELARQAWLAEAATPAAWHESVDLLRIGKAEINAHPDGIDVGGPMMESLALLGLLSREAAADPDNPGTRGVIEDTSNAIAGAPAMVVLKTRGNTRVDQVETGRRWLRLNLATTAAGLALRPVSQALQEYAEVQPFHEAVHAEFAAPGETVQMLGLLGYGALTPRTPRWPVETRLRNV